MMLVNLTRFSAPPLIVLLIIEGHMMVIIINNIIPHAVEIFENTHIYIGNYTKNSI